MPTVDTVADNAWLKLIGRGVMVLAVPLFMWILGYISGLSASITALDQRVSLNELKVTSNTISINEFKNSLSNLDQRTILILQSVARLEAVQAARTQVAPIK